MGRIWFQTQTSGEPPSGPDLCLHTRFLDGDPMATQLSDKPLSSAGQHTREIWWMATPVVLFCFQASMFVVLDPFEKKPFWRFQVQCSKLRVTSSSAWSSTWSSSGGDPLLTKTRPRNGNVTFECRPPPPPTVAHQKENKLCQVVKAYSNLRTTIL